MSRYDALAAEEYDRRNDEDEAAAEAALLRDEQEAQVGLLFRCSVCSEWTDLDTDHQHTDPEGIF